MWFGTSMKPTVARARIAAILAISPIAVGGSAAGGDLAAHDRAARQRPALDEVERFAVYFSGPFRSDLGCYDMAVVDPDDHSPAEIGRLRAVGTLPIAYLNVGEVETYRWFHPRVDPSWILGVNPNWENHYYVDAREEGWQSLLLEEVIPRILEKGYAGLLLDMVDTALPGLYPETEPGMIELVHRIRGRHPDLALIMNHGFFLADRVSEAIDAVVVEGTFTYYDFDQDAYRRTAVEVQESQLGMIDSLRETHGLEAFLIDYAGSEDDELRAYARRRAEETGLRSFLGTIRLDTVPRPEDASASSSCLEGAKVARTPDSRP